MILAYADESGDSGYDGSPTGYFVLAILMIRDADWLTQLDRLTAMRAYLRKRWGIPPTEELKASRILRPRGAFYERGLALEDRREIYRLAMQFQRAEKVYTTFAVCIDKTKILKRDRDPREFAWQFAIERLDNYAGRLGEWVSLYPDAGHGYFIRRMVRRMRRFHSVASAYGEGGRLEASALRVVEDPSDRDSSESYFIQLADLNAYAAARYLWPTTKAFGREMWNELGDARLEKVNRIRGGPPGIKVFP